MSPRMKSCLAFLLLCALLTAGLPSAQEHSIGSLFVSSDMRDRQPQPFAFGVYQYPTDGETTLVKMVWEIPVDELVTLDKKYSTDDIPNFTEENEEGEEVERKRVEFDKGAAVFDVKYRVKKRDIDAPLLDEARLLHGPIDRESKKRGYTYMTFSPQMNPGIYSFAGGVRDIGAELTNPDVIEESAEEETKVIKNFDSGDLAISDIMIARGFSLLEGNELEEAKDDPKRKNYLHGDFEIYPNVQNAVKKGDEIAFHFQVVNISPENRMKGHFQYSYRFLGIGAGEDGAPTQTEGINETAKEGNVIVRVPTKDTSFFKPGVKYQLQLQVFVAPEDAGEGEEVQVRTARAMKMFSII